MKWYNEPGLWAGDAQQLQMTVAPGTDFWRITHYDFIRDSGPFYFTGITGDFEAAVKVSGKYQELYHQAGLMIRIDETQWIKTGIEYVDGMQQVSAVVTRGFSDWSVVPRNDNPPSVWLKLLRKGDYVQVSYSFNNEDYLLLRLAYFPPGTEVQIGLFAAAPGEQSFQVVFEDLTIMPLA